MCNLTDQTANELGLPSAIQAFISSSRPLRANTSETFDCVKFTLEGAGERSDGNARTSAHALARRA